MCFSDRFRAQGKDGAVAVVTCIVARRDIPIVRAAIAAADPNAFITVEESRPMSRGYFRH